MVQDFPDLNLSLGFVLPLSFTPVITPGVAWTGSHFVAVSATGTVLTSPNGSTWTTQTSGTVNNLRAVASSPTLLVAVGSDGAILTSTNGGTSWTAQTSGTKANLVSVTWSGSQFVAVGMLGTAPAILTSPNGVAWTSRNAGPASMNLYGVAWTGKQFVAVGSYGSGGVVLNSRDGVTWTLNSSAVALATQGILEAVTWSGAQLVAVGAMGGNGEATILFSTDGNTWSAPSSSESVPTWEALDGVVWSPAKKLFVAVGQQGTILTSPDTNMWTSRTSNTTYNLKAVAWSGTEFLAIGSANTVVTSPDGITWTVQAAVPDGGQMLHYSSSGSSVVSGPPGGLKMTAPTLETLAVTGGVPYGGATFTGYAGDLVVFIPSPTGWTATDAAHNQRFEIAENSSRIFAGTIAQISPARTLATFTLDRSGTGSIVYSDGSKAAVTNWLPAN
jgi:hypothetical protein